MGSNVGAREANLRAAVLLLEEQIDVDAVSSVWSTQPYGVVNQPDFLNIAVAGRSDLDPHDLLWVAKQIEREVGRTPTYRWGPRILDVDIVLYGDLIVDDPDLSIPHREMAGRAFVLAALAEIAPDAIHPVTGKTIQCLLDSLDQPAAVERLGPLF